ncbi:hypothetical protein HOB94_01790 [bacterium]|nr:hypothetical protein [bacterium]
MENSSYEKSIESRETEQDGTATERLIQTLEQDLKIAFSEPLFNPETSIADNLKNIKEGLGILSIEDEFADREIESIIKSARLNVLIDQIVLDLIKGETMSIESFELKASKFVSSKRNLSELVEHYHQILEEIEDQGKLVDIKISDLLNSYAKEIDLIEDPDSIICLAPIAEALIDSVEIFQFIEKKSQHGDITLQKEKSLQVLRLPLIDLIINEACHNNHRYVGKTEEDLPDFVKKQTNHYTNSTYYSIEPPILNIEKAQAFIFYEPNKQGRYLVIAHNTPNVESLELNILHEIRHLVNRKLFTKIKDIAFDENFFYLEPKDRLPIVENFLLDELIACSINKSLPAVANSKRGYLIDAIYNRLLAALDQEKKEKFKQSDEYKDFIDIWEEIDEKIKFLSNLTQNNRKAQLIIYNLLAFAKSTYDILDRLIIIKARFATFSEK